MQATVASIPAHGNIRYEIHKSSSPAGSHSHSHPSPYMLSLCPWVSILLFNLIPVNGVYNKQTNIVTTNQNKKQSPFFHPYPFPCLAVLADGLVSHSLSLSLSPLTSLLSSPLSSLSSLPFSSLPFPSLPSSSLPFPLLPVLLLLLFPSLSALCLVPTEHLNKTFFFVFSFSSRFCFTTSPLKISSQPSYTNTLSLFSFKPSSPSLPFSSPIRLHLFRPNYLHSSLLTHFSLPSFCIPPSATLIQFTFTSTQHGSHQGN
ncbi:hypothetical protein BKA57DRAFT_231587 [Linnemannia elongata]|nr:hypothetical protein BKA57DRAFT_231587 [Linnemannia elongata]